MNHTIPIFKDDGFSITATEPWFKVKVQVIQSYLHAFVTAAASRADEIIFIDLFSGNGLFSIGHKKEIFAGSSLAGLAMDLPINRYIFCEEDQHEAKVLRSRADQYFPEKDVTVFEGNLENIVIKLKNLFPLAKNNRTAIFCLIDPFSLKVPFTVAEQLVELGFSLLVPFTFHLNGRLNSAYYLKEKQNKLKRFVGAQAEKLNAVQGNLQFYRHLVKIYEQNMLMKGLNASLTVHKLNSQLMELPMYYIGYFSRQISPKIIGRDIQMTDQLQFDLF